MKILTIQTKATEQYFPLALFTMLYKEVLKFVFVAESYNVTDHSNESYWAVLSCGVPFIIPFKMMTNKMMMNTVDKKRPFKKKLSSSTFLWFC